MPWMSLLLGIRQLLNFHVHQIDLESIRNLCFNNLNKALKRPHPHEDHRYGTPQANKAR
jgi:hypothetical protein